MPTVQIGFGYPGVSVFSLYRVDQGNWSQAHDSASAELKDADLTECGESYDAGTAVITLYRGFVALNTQNIAPGGSSIPAGSTIDSATVHIYDFGTLSSLLLTAVVWNNPSGTTGVLSDYSNLGSVSLGSATIDPGSSDVPISIGSGLVVAADGYIYFGLRGAYDLSNTDPSGVVNVDHVLHVIVWGADVTYTVAPGGGGGIGSGNPRQLVRDAPTRNLIVGEPKRRASIPVQDRMTTIHVPARKTEFHVNARESFIRIESKN